MKYVHTKFLQNYALFDNILRYFYEGVGGCMKIPKQVHLKLPDTKNLRVRAKCNRISINYKFKCDALTWNDRVLINFSSEEPLLTP